MRRVNVLVLTAFALLFGAAWLTPTAPNDSVRIESIGDLLLTVQPVAVAMPTQYVPVEMPALLAHTDTVSMTLGAPVTDIGGHAMAYEPSNTDRSFNEISILDVLDIMAMLSRSDSTYTPMSSNFNPSVTDLVYS